MEHLSKEIILLAFSRLEKELARQGITGELFIMGGAAMALLFNARQTTRDVDAVFIAYGSLISSAARNIAKELQLPEDWLNEGAKGYLNGIAEGPYVFSSAGLQVRTLAIPQLLAMKLSAWRDDLDIADARLLLRNCTGSREEIWASVQSHLVPGRELKARYAFDDLWNEDNGPH